MVENVFRIGPLGVGGGIERLARQIGHGVDGVPLLQNIEYPQCVDSQYLNGPIALGVQGGSHIGGHSGNIRVTVEQRVFDLLVIRDNGALQCEGHPVKGVLGGVVVHQPGCAYPGGPREGHEFESGDIGHRCGLVRGGTCLSGAGGTDWVRNRGTGPLGGGILGPAARQQGQGQGGGEEEREGTFHHDLPFLFWDRWFWGAFDPPLQQ